MRKYNLPIYLLIITILIALDIVYVYNNGITNKIGLFILIDLIITWLGGGLLGIYEDY